MHGARRFRADAIRSLKRVTLAIAIVTTVAPWPAYAGGVAPAPDFDDGVCPQANPAGRNLNDLNARGSADNDAIVYAAQGLIDAYHDCASEYDRAYASKGIPDPEDHAFFHRVYARLELALAFQRVGLIAEQLQQPDSARAQYDGALQTLDDIERVVRTCPLRPTSTTGKLVAQARDLHVAIVQVESELRPAR